MKNHLINTLLLLMVMAMAGCSDDGGSLDNPPAASASLSWVAPVTRDDGTSLSMAEIAGYKIYMGSNTTDLTLIADITDSYIMEYEVTSLDSGTYYFAVSAYDVDSTESDISNVVSKTI